MSDGGDLEPHEVDALIRSLGYADARVEVRGPIPCKTALLLLADNLLDLLLFNSGILKWFAFQCLVFVELFLCCSVAFPFPFGAPFRIFFLHVCLFWPCCIREKPGAPDPAARHGASVRRDRAGAAAPFEGAAARRRFRRGARDSALL